MADWLDDGDLDDDEYEIWADDDTIDTGKAPRFVKVPSASLTPEQLAAMRVDELIQTYRAVRDQLTTDRRGYKKREAALKTHLQVISMNLRDHGDRVGTDSFVTPFGTAFRKKIEKFTVSGWDAFTRWLDQTKNYQVVQKRVSPNAVKEVRDVALAEFKLKNPDVDDKDINMLEMLPPGIAVLEEVEFAVRAPTASRYRK